MSSLILRWSLDNSSSNNSNNGSTPLPPYASSSFPPNDVQPKAPSPSSLLSPSSVPPSLAPLAAASQGDVGGGGRDGDGRARQRELRGSLQAFLEIRQVWRLLSGRGETDPSVQSIAGKKDNVTLEGVFGCGVCLDIICASKLIIGDIRPERWLSCSSSHLKGSCWSRPPRFALRCDTATCFLFSNRG